MNNVFIERLWRTVNYECVYLHEFENGNHARRVLRDWFKGNIEERFHMSMDDLTPDEIYRGKPFNRAARD